MSEINRLRQLGIISDEILNRSHVTVIGAGSIGSYTALALGKMGVGKLTIYDYDTVASHNIPNQFYTQMDIPKQKVIALIDNLKYHCYNDIQSIVDKFSISSSCRYSNIIISGVDSMKSRKEIWDDLIRDKYNGIYIDGRMGAEIIEIYSVDMSVEDSRRFYESKLWNDDDPNVSEARCTEKSISYTSFIIAGLLTHQVKRVLCNEVYSPMIHMDIPLLELSRIDY